MIVNLCGINAIHAKGFKIDRPNGGENYLFLRLKTPARFWVDGQVCSVAPDDVILYRKGDPQLYEGSATDCYIDDFIHFDVSCADDEQFIDRLPLIFNRPLRLPYIHPFMQIHQMLCIESVGRGAERETAVDSLLRYFLIKLSECMNAGYSATDRAVYERFNALRLALYSSPARKWTVAEMAGEVNLSPSYFQNLYKDLFHTSCLADLITARMTHARELLTTTALPIVEVAAECGYASNIYFSRHFKQKVGMTPGEYRRMNHR